jgi:hypothetical protein
VRSSCLKAPAAKAQTVIAVATGDTNSGAASAAYTINLPVVSMPAFSPGQNFPWVTVGSSATGGALNSSITPPTDNPTRQSAIPVVNLC